jgi:hypothetical protein
MEDSNRKDILTSKDINESLTSDDTNLEKSVNTKLVHLATIASLLGVPYSSNMQPPKAVAAAPAVVPSATPHPGLEPIAYMESRNGRNQRHKLVTWGLNSGTKAVGKYGLMPLTVHETAKHDSTIGRMYPEFKTLDPIKDHDKYEKILLANPQVQDHIANSHWGRLTRTFGKDKNRAVYAWKYGITGAKTASHSDVSSAPYVREYNKHHNMLNVQTKKSLRKSEFQLPQHFSFISAQRGGDHNHDVHQRLYQDLRDSGFDPVEVTGHYGYQERSFLVPHTGSAVDRNKVEDLGRKYNQESVLHSSDLNNELVNLEDPTKSMRGSGISNDYSDAMYTELPGGSRFKLNLRKTEVLEKADGQPNPQARQVAEGYANSKGIKLRRLTPVKVNPQFATHVAGAYEKMPHSPSSPDTKRSYDALISETLDQFQHMKNAGLKISKIKPGMENPYKSSKDLFHDVQHNNHMWYFPTESGFGSSETRSDHPMLAPTEEMHEGKPMLANDVFRVVHDYFGHAKEGHAFGPNGEENAWQTHAQMYSPEARRAMTAETRGQNSWVNFGPHAAHNRSNPHQTVYADQKAGLLPDWAHAVDPTQAFSKSEDDDKVLYHYSQHPEPLKIIDPVFHGTGYPGAEGKRDDRVARAYYYDTPTGHEPDVISGATHMYTVKHPGNILDVASEEAEPFKEKARNQYGIIDYSDLERHMKDAGYNGYKNTASAIPNAVALFHPQQVDESRDLRKSEELEKASHNVREQKAKVFGTKANPPAGSQMREKHIEHINNFAKKFLNLEIRPSGGKINEATGQRRSESPKIGTDKPDWRSGQLEAQWNPEAIMHELAHLMLLPSGVGLKEGQRLMDKQYGEVQSKYGYMQQKRSQGEVQPMAAEQIIRRHLGLPASRVSIPVESKDAPPRVSVEAPDVVIGTRVPQPTKSGAVKWVDLIRQSRLLNTENRKRLEDIFSGNIKFHPELGWIPKKTSISTQKPKDELPTGLVNDDVEPSKLASSEKVYTSDVLEKGVKQRLFYFSPAEVPEEHKQKVAQWTDPLETNISGDREVIPRLEGNARMRALHTLSSKTKTRWNPDKKEREFLLHRGVSGSEHNRVINNGHVEHPGKSSWSPKHTTAVNWMDQYGGLADEDPSVLSAWIPESKIHHVPMQIGATERVETVKPGNKRFSPTGKLQGPMEWRNEHEVIVDPGSHKVATEKEVKSTDKTSEPTDINERINRKMTKSEYDPAKDVTAFTSFSTEPGDIELVREINEMIEAGHTRPLGEKGLFTEDSFVVGEKPDNSWLIKVEVGNTPGIKAVQYTGPQSVKEAAFYKASEQVFGLSRFVPKSVLGEVQTKDVPKLAVAIKMLPPEFKNAAETEGDIKGMMKGLLEKYKEAGLSHMLAFMLYVLGDLDAHGNNLMTDGYNVVLIDHGSSFADLSSEDKSDKKQFVPYILRHEGFKGKLSDNDKQSHMPLIDSPEIRANLKEYIMSVDPKKLHDVVVSYGLNPVPSVTRLKVAQKMLEHSDHPDVLVNYVWIKGAPADLVEEQEGVAHEVGA